MDELEDNRPIVRLDLSTIPIFPEEEKDWFDDAVWDAAALFAEGAGVHPFHPDFGEIFEAARVIAARLKDLSPVIAAMACSTMEEWVKSGALEFTVPDASVKSTEEASVDVEAMIVSLSACACAAAVLAGVAVQTGMQVQVERPAIVEFPLTVR
jgi:hypothetical protein